ncbi:UNVERIFIED_CONTAM: hypothetical protein HDU68_008169 [Siphonaria sp. JEL0065]|nr:hypothetical protein HDU68_008169 [Siphonaria sp. JEL0065]
MIVSASIFPHGTMVLDPTKEGLPEGASALHKACQAAADQVASTKPTTIILITPHSLSLSHSTAIILGPEAKGNAEWNENWSNFEATVNISGYSTALIENMRSNGLAVEGLTAFSRLPCPLRWGEVVPIHFLHQTLPDLHYIIISPARGQSISTNLKLGSALFKFLHSFQTERFAVVVSGDLSHAHSTTEQDPIYLPDPRWNMPTDDAIASQFDQLIADWVTGGDRNTLLKNSAEIKAKAMSCGFDGFVWLQGGFESLRTVRFKGRVLTNTSPTYFGMLVGVFDVEAVVVADYVETWNPFVILWGFLFAYLVREYARIRDSLL